jgi:hypothetical protein
MAASPRLATALSISKQPAPKTSASSAAGPAGSKLGVLGSAYTGTVSGFGQNTHQFIDLTDIDSAGATFSYTSISSDSGTLTVTSGGTSASITMSGHYTSASFHISSGTGGTVEVTDPPVAEQQPGHDAHASHT